MNKQEIQNKFEDLEKQLAELKEQVNSIEDEEVKKGVRQMPKMDEVYYCINSLGEIIYTIYEEDEADLFRFNTGNCFKTKQAAEEYKENLLTKQALKDLALELNNGVEVDWSNMEQIKFFLAIETEHRELFTAQTACIKYTGAVHCLSEFFSDIAKERIGEEKLIKLIKSGI